MANDFSGDANCVALWNFESGTLYEDSIGSNDLDARLWEDFPNVLGVPNSPVGTFIDYESTSDRFYGRKWTADCKGTITHLNIRYGAEVNFGANGAWLTVFNNDVKVGQWEDTSPSASTWTGDQVITVIGGQSLDFAIDDVIHFGLCFDGSGSNGGISWDNGLANGYNEYCSTITVGETGANSPLSFSTSETTQAGACLLTYKQNLANTSVYKVGSQSAEFIDGVNRVVIADDDLDVGFPWRHADGGSVETDFTFAFWMRMKTLPNTLGKITYVISKYSTADLRCFGITVQQDEAKLGLNMGTDSGTAYDGFDSALYDYLEVDTWYHIAIRYINSTRTGYMTCWDDTAQEFLFQDYDQVLNGTTVIEDIQFAIGGRSDLAGSFDGYLDEIVVFDECISSAEVDLIRAGTFGATGSTYSLISTVAAVTTLDAVTLNVNRQLISSIVNATTVSSIDVLFIVKFISTIVMSTTVSSVDVLKILNFISTIAEEVSVSGIDLNVERLLVATTELVTTLGDIDLPIERLLESAVANVTTASSIDLLRINNFISTITNTTTLSSIDVGITFLLISTIAMVTTLDPITVVQVLIDGIASSGVVDKTYLYKALGVFADAYVVRDYSYNEHVVDKSYVYTTKNATI